MTKLTTRLRMSAVLGALLLVAVAGCGNDNAEAGSSGSGSGGDQQVTIKEPTDGASVEVPFKLSLDSKVELGPTESGKHHVHLFFDGDDSEYEVIESNSVDITDASPAVKGLEPGEHELDISLRNADHSAAGFDTSIKVMVGGSGGNTDDDSGTGGGGY